MQSVNSRQRFIVRVSLIGAAASWVALFTFGALTASGGPEDKRTRGKAKFIKDNFQYMADSAVIGKKQKIIVSTHGRCGAHRPNLQARLFSRGGAARVRAAIPNYATMGQLRKIAIPVRFIVIHSGETGKVTEADLDKQLGVLNTTYQNTGFRFTKHTVVHYDAKANSKNWFVMRQGTNREVEAKSALGKDQTKALNFYTCKPEGFTEQGWSPILGFAAFPWELTSQAKLDGVVVDYDTLPGGALTEYNLGKTATHEVGHWLGLWHTFQDGCSLINDEVEDTPRHSGSADTNNNSILDIFECWQPADKLNTCGANDPNDDGLDPIDNYMNYGSDACISKFTAGQAKRMREQVLAFRMELVNQLLLATDRRKLNKALRPLRGGGE